MFDTQLSRRDFGKGMFAVSLLGIMGATAGCSTGAQTTPGGTASAAKGGTLTMAVDADISLNPAKNASAGSTQMYGQAVYDTLLRFQPDGKIVPNIAEKYEENADKTVLTLTLKDGVTFSDGTAFDATAAAGNLAQGATSVPIAVRGGGHSAWGSVPGGLTLDMAAFTDIEVEGLQGFAEEARQEW